ncbi:hypothetical protein JYU34_017105 [Plutella xylostella]|uniref:Uncharacterized protein n=1 Tax=Plutella xylostella TaxID=51655 RepID=A0ABQ7Q164_PLUXY|nr:hypothetical protein JYU34_017105 [Plutella xylostella]
MKMKAFSWLQKVSPQPMVCRGMERRRRTSGRRARRPVRHCRPVAPCPPAPPRPAPPRPATHASSQAKGRGVCSSFIAQLFNLMTRISVS